MNPHKKVTGIKVLLGSSAAGADSGLPGDTLVFQEYLEGGQLLALPCKTGITKVLWLRNFAELCEICLGWRLN